MSYFSKNYSHIKYPLATAKDKGLRAAQLGAIHAINSHFTISKEPAIVILPTGTGKTLVLVVSAFTQSAKRVLVLVPNSLVRRQIFKKFSTLEDLKEYNVINKKIASPKVIVVESRIKTIKEWNKLKSYDVIIGTPGCLSPHYADVSDPPDNFFDLILVDEAHHGPAKTWKKTLDVFEDVSKILYTATPYRQDGKEIPGHFIYTYPLSKALTEGVYSQIKFIPVNLEQENFNDDFSVNSDICIAKKAEELFESDKKAGYDHSIVVKAKTQKRAKEIHALYKEHTKLELRLLISECSSDELDENIELLEQRKIDGVICVQMLAEGYNLPNLKIAAIHTPPSSLSVTLQFIGRFARTEAHGLKLGEAKFIAVPSDIQSESSKLYTESADWQDLVINLSDSSVEAEKRTREGIASFQSPLINLEELKDLPIYTLYPYLHAKVYKLPPDTIIDFSTEVELHDYNIGFQSYSNLLTGCCLVTYILHYPKWSKSDQVKTILYDFHVVYHDTDADLLFIGSTSKSDLLYSQLAFALTKGQHKILPLYQLKKVLLKIEKVKLHNIGLVNCELVDTAESYDTRSGPNADKALDETIPELYFQGHIAATGEEDSEKTSIGYSRSSKVWSIGRRRKIPEYVQWCKEISRKLISSEDPITGTNLDAISAGQELNEIPDGILCALWGPNAYRKEGIRISIPNKSYENAAITLIDLDLEIDYNQTNQSQIFFSISFESIQSNYIFQPLSNDSLFEENSTESAFFIENNFDTIPLIDYLNENPLNFYFSERVLIHGETLYRIGIESPIYDESKFNTDNWPNSSVKIRKEEPDEKIKRKKIPQGDSIHEYLINRIGKDHESIFYDQGSGEIADIVSLYETTDNIVVSFYHCKASSKSSPGCRVEDMYEVCGQAIRSLNWVRSERLFSRLVKRNQRQNSLFVKGSLDQFRRIVERGHNKRISYNIWVVQPGLSKSKFLKNDKMKRLVSGINSSVKRLTQNNLFILGSD